MNAEYIHNASNILRVNGNCVVDADLEKWLSFFTS